MTIRQEDRVALVGLLACALALLVARGSETWLGLVPCALCLIERRPYEFGAALAAVALLLPRAAARPVLWVLVAVLAVGAAISFTHVGVEQHWWPDPLPECRAPDFTGMTMSQRLAAMPARPVKPCETPDYLVSGLPISFTQMGLAYALTVSAVLAFFLSRRLHPLAAGNVERNDADP